MLDFEVSPILLAAYLLLLSGGTYFTYFHQGETIADLNRRIETAKDRGVEQTSLEERRSTLEKRAERMETAGRNRYKVIPKTVSTPEIMGYLTELTAHGFEALTLEAAGRQEEEGYRVYTVNADGKASFSTLYHFVWTLENNRPFYRIRDLQLSLLDERSTEEETGRTTMDVLVAFQMEIQAIYGRVGSRAVEGGRHDGREDEDLPTIWASSHPPLPSHVLPPQKPAVNPFYPLVFSQVPPNEHGRLNVETARLLSVIEDEAVFESEQGVQRLREGDRVYLGRIVEVNPADGRVVARLNKGGIIDRVEQSVHVGGSSSTPGDGKAMSPNPR